MTDHRGHRSIPHTADTIVEAWGPDLASCLTEAGRGLVAEFVQAPEDLEGIEHPFHLTAPDIDRLVVDLLDEVIYLVDAEGLVPAELVVNTASEGECRGVLRLVPVDSVVQIGSAPKSVSLSGLRVHQSDDGWTCRIVVDV